VGLTVDAYARQLKQLLPRGLLWRLDSDSWLSRLLLSVAEELARIDARGLDLVNEWDPSTAEECLEDWERVLGLPDTCAPLADTVAGREAVAARKYVYQGGQSAAFFVALAASLGYTATVVETTANMWRMDVVLDAGLTTFRAGSSRAGDRLSSWTAATDLECAVNRAKPAHTYVLFAYS
jgi:uncharacterized protein YmfQ (DUF2313 family)